MSSFFRAIVKLVQILWYFTPDGLKDIWSAVPARMHPVIIIAVSVGLIAAGFRIEKLWLRIVMYSLGGVLILCLIAQSLNYS